MSFQTLNSVLWNERQLFELLLFKLEEEQLLLAAGKTRWLSHSTREVENVLEQIREHSLVRAVSSDEVADLLQLPSGVPLSTLAESAQSPWNELLSAHRVALIGLNAEIESIVSVNRELLTASQKATQETLHHLQTESATYTHNGVAQPGEVQPQILDQSL